jgi:hypothetical protein
MKNKNFDETSKLITSLRLTCESIVAANSNTEAA